MQSRVTVVNDFAQTHFDPWIVVAESFILLAVAWVIVGNRYFFEGDTMERPANRIAQLYGYTVCLIAVIVFLVSVQSIASALLSLHRPLASSDGYGMQSLDSFEAYKATFDEPSGPYVTEEGAAVKKTPMPSDAELRARYEALRAERISSNIYDAQKDITLSGLMLVIAVVLFIVHWRWLRTLSSA